VNKANTHVSVTDERILSAALQVFLEKGFTGATTRVIAVAADINEVTLFRHYGNKLNLLKAVVEHFSPLADLENVVSSQLSGNYHDDLRMLGKHIIKQMTDQPDILTFLMISGREIPELPDLLMDIPLRLIVLLSEFFQRHITQGAVRQNFSPSLLSRVFFSQIIGFVISTHQINQHMLAVPPQLEQAMLPLEQAVDQFVDIFIFGTDASVQAPPN
jgi:AcrR family transcriptional regulator